MPPENSAQQKSDELKKVAGVLESRVDQLEPPGVKNSPEDWSEKVRKTIQQGEAHIRKTVEELSQYLPDPERFLAEKLEAYRKEIDGITIWFPLDEKNVDIKELTDDLLSDNTLGRPNHEEVLARAKKQIAEKPEDFIWQAGVNRKFELLTEKEIEILLQDAVKRCIDTGHEDVLHYEFLHEMPFLDSEVERTIQKLKNGHSSRLFEFITRMVETRSDFIRRSDIAAVLPKLFEECFFEGRSLIFISPYSIYKEQPWFEEALKAGFERAKREDPLNAFRVLVIDRARPELLAKDYIKTSMKQLVEAAMKKNKSIVIYNCDVYRSAYSEQEWKDVLIKGIKDSDDFDIQQMAWRLATLRTKLPQDVFAVLIHRVIFVSPKHVLRNYAHLSGVPAEYYFEEAVKRLMVIEPGEMLEYLHEDVDKKLPFENRNGLMAKAAMKASYVNPTAVIKYSSMYVHFPLAPDILARAKKRSFISRNLELAHLNSDINTSDFSLFRDPALLFVEDIERTWLPITLNDHQFAEMAVMITRNLYLSGSRSRITRKDCKSEYQKIIAARAKYEHVPIFADRNVVVASHIEKWGKEKDRFGTEAFIDAVRKQQGEGRELSHFKSKEKTIEALQKTKKDILEKIKTIEWPMTFVFDGHGGPDALYLSDGQIAGLETADKQDIIETEKTIKITVDDLVDALSVRSTRIGKKKVAEEILVFSSCYSHTFLRSMYEKLQARGVGKPIALGLAEFGQVSYSKKESPYGAAFFDHLMENGKKSTLGDIWHMPIITDINPSLYIPSGDIPQHIGDNGSQNEAIS